MSQKCCPPLLVLSIIILAALFATAAFLLPLANAHAAATTFTVNSLADTDDGNCDSSPDCSLREAITAANGNLGADTIVFSGTGTINLTGPLPDITDDVAINGPGAAQLTVRRDTGIEYRIFNVTTSGVVTFSGLTISDGLAVGRIGEGNGGAINNVSSGTVNVNNCTLTNNSTGTVGQLPFAGSGGAIFNSGGTLNVTNCTLRGNSTAAFGTGGAIWNGGTATITNSTLTNNFVVAGRGGAIYSFGPMTVDSCTISDNSTHLSSGGGIYNEGMFELTQSTLNNNSAFSDGGGIFNTGDAITVTNSTLTANSAGEFGGGIFNTGVATLTCTTLTNNSAAVSGGGVVNSNTLTFDSSVVALNTAPASPDLSGVITSQGHNAVGNTSGSTFAPVPGDQVGVTSGQLNLGPLQNNGGSTQTMALGTGSVAIDAGDEAVISPPLSLTTDQRGTGFQRRSGIQVDVGAFEVQQPHVGPPTNKDQCKNGRWRNFDTPRRFANQGDCIQFVNTGR